MIPLRATFYVLYVALGALIVVRLLSVGLYWQSISGLLLGGLLMALGLYRLWLLLRMRRPR